MLQRQPLLDLKRLSNYVTKRVSQKIPQKGLGVVLNQIFIKTLFLAIVGILLSTVAVARPRT